MSTRNYISNFRAINFALQTNDEYCVYYALNNLIQTSPFIKYKPLITLDDFRQYKNELCTHGSEEVREFFHCSEEFFTYMFMYEGLVPSLGFVYLLPTSMDNYNFQLAIPKPYIMKYNETYEKKYIEKLFDKYYLFHTEFKILPETIRRNSTIVGTLLGVKYKSSDSSTQGHAIAIVPIYPYNEYGINKYIYMDSGSQEYQILSERKLIRKLRIWNIDLIIRVYLR